MSEHAQASAFPERNAADHRPGLLRRSAFAGLGFALPLAGLLLYALGAGRDASWLPAAQFLALLLMLGAQFVLLARALRVAALSPPAPPEARDQPDPLTGLPRLPGLRHRAEQALALNKRDGLSLAVVYIDLDHFAQVNDTLGRQLGDQLLADVAARIRSCVRESDIVARVDGDKFVMVLTGIGDSREVGALLGKVHALMSKPYHLAGSQWTISFSLGISMAPSDGEDVDALLGKAETAVSRSKGRERSGFHFFTPAVAQLAQEKVVLEAQLRQTLDAGGLSLHYQPQVRADDGRLVGFEALARWRHPDRGFIPPGDFVAVAQVAGMMDMMSRWVLDTACGQLRAWREQGHVCPRIALNLPTDQLSSERMRQRVMHTLAENGLQGGDLELEITETLAMENPQETIAQMRALGEAGVQIAIDDFGTGYSSLAYLKLLPADTLKLDRAFIADIESDGRDASICHAVVTLAHELGMDLVAEGVETPGQRELLTGWGCDVLQGGLVGDPLPADGVAVRWFGEHAPG